MIQSCIGHLSSGSKPTPPDKLSCKWQVLSVLGSRPWKGDNDGMSSEKPFPAGDTPQPSDPRSQEQDAATFPAPVRVTVENPRVTRTAVIWGAVAVSLVVLVLLIVFFIQNQDMITVKFLGWEGRLAQGIAFFIAAVGGGILVAIAGGARIFQLHANERRRRKNAVLQG